MKNFQLTKYGEQPSFTLSDTEIPTAGPGKVVVRVHAAGWNPLDGMIARGEMRQLFSYKLPQTLGQEFAGVITEVGEGVSEFEVGQKVFGRPNMKEIGTFAEYVEVSVEDIAQMPATLSFVEAAALPLVMLTAYQAFTEKANIGKGSKVFIQGGAGGLGSVAIQVAKYLGATVATTVSTKDVEFARNLGADIVVDYRTQRYEDMVKDFDFVLDTLGGNESIRAMSVLAPGGKVVSVAGNPSQEMARDIAKPYLTPAMWWLSRKERAAAKRQGVSYEFLFMHESGEQLKQLTPAIENGTIRPQVGEVLSLEQTEQVFRLGSRKRGKAVIEIAGEAK